MKFNIFDKSWWSRNNLADGTDHRTSIKSQVTEDEEEDIKLSAAEQEIADRFDKLPGKCKRKAQRMIKGGPESWQELSTFCDEHEVLGHHH